MLRTKPDLNYERPTARVYHDGQTSSMADTNPGLPWFALRRHFLLSRGGVNPDLALQDALIHLDSQSARICLANTHPGRIHLGLLLVQRV
jgi:hypothetical protein